MSPKAAGAKLLIHVTHSAGTPGFPNQTPVLKCRHRYTEYTNIVKFQRPCPSPHQTTAIAPVSSTGRKFLPRSRFSKLPRRRSDDYGRRSGGERRRGRRWRGRESAGRKVVVRGRRRPPRGPPRRGRELPQLPGHPLLVTRKLRLPCKDLSFGIAICLAAFGGV